MSSTASNVRVAQNGGSLHIAKISATTTAPTGVGSSLTTNGYTELGYITEDGVAIGYSRATEDIMAWQSQWPVRTVTTGQELTVKATLEETSAEVAGLWLGVDFETNGAEFKAEGAVLATTTEYEVAVTWVDDTITNVLYIPRAVVVEQGDVQLTKAGSINYEVTFKALAPDSGALFTWFTNDSALNPA